MARSCRTALLAFVAILSAATGCAGPGGSEGPRATPSSPPTADGQFATDRILTEASMRTRAGANAVAMASTIADGTDRFVVSMRGEFDFRADMGTLLVTLPGGAISRAEERIVGDSLYFRYPADPAQPERLVWVRVRRAEAKVRYLLRPPGNDPGYVLEQLTKTRSVRLVGSEPIAGTPTRHYRGFLDLPTVARDFDPTRRDQLLRSEDAWPDDGVPVDVWVDASGTVRRVVQSLDFGGTATRLQLDLTKPVGAVRVTPPDPAETVEGELQGILMG
jgi:hypothetical protein